MWQTVAIPAIQYLNMLLAWLFIYVLIALENYFRRESCFGPPTPAWNVIYVAVILLLYAVVMLGSVILNYIEVNFLLLMQLYAFVFIILCGITIMLHKRMVGPFRRNRKINSISTS